MMPRPPASKALLIKLQDSLGKPRGTKELVEIMEQFGRAEQRYSRAAQHYNVEIPKDDMRPTAPVEMWVGMKHGPLRPVFADLLAESKGFEPLMRF